MVSTFAFPPYAFRWLSTQEHRLSFSVDIRCFVSAIIFTFPFLVGLFFPAWQYSDDSPTLRVSAY